jgi:YVTN family beta-propeller protein
MRRLLIPILLAGCSSARPVDGPAANPNAEPTGTLLVSNQKGASATVIDLANGNAITIPVGTGPHEAAISHDGHTGAISIYGIQPAGNQIAIIDMKTATVRRMIDLGTYRRPHGMAFLPGDQKLVATSEASGNIVIVDVKTGTVEAAVPTKARSSHMLAVPPSATRLFTANVGDGSISEIDLGSRTNVATYPVSTQTEGIAISPDGRFVWVGSNNAGIISVFNTATKKIETTIPGVGAPYRIGISPDGKLAIAADPPGARINLIDTGTYQIVASIPLIGGPEGIAISPDSRTAYITLNESSEVAMIDLVARRELRRWRTGEAPDGIAYTTVRR